MTDHKYRLSDEDPAICEAIHAALEHVPVTADQAEQAGKTLPGNAPPLPAALAEPKAIFNKPARAAMVIPFPALPEVDATLARAAREAGHLTPEVQEQMRRDRQAAQAEAKANNRENPNGPDVR